MNFLEKFNYTELMEQDLIQEIANRIIEQQELSRRITELQAELEQIERFIELEGSQMIM